MVEKPKTRLGGVGASYVQIRELLELSPLQHGPMRRRACKWVPDERERSPPQKEGVVVSFLFSVSSAIRVLRVMWPIAVLGRTPRRQQTKVPWGRIALCVAAAKPPRDPVHLRETGITCRSGTLCAGAMLAYLCPTEMLLSEARNPLGPDRETKSAGACGLRAVHGLPAHPNARDRSGASSGGRFGG